MEEILEVKRIHEIIVLPAIKAKKFTLPNQSFSFDLVDTDLKQLRALDEATRNYDGRFVLLIPKDDKFENPAEGDFYEYALLARKTPIINKISGVSRVRAEVKARVKILDFLTTESSFVVEVSEVDDIYDDKEKEEVLLKKIRTLYAEKKDAGYTGDKPNTKPILDGTSSGIIADSAAVAASRNQSSLVKYVGEPNVNKRLLYVLTDLKSLELDKEIERTIDDEVRQSMNEAQREYMLREKLKAIQNQLGDKAKKEEDIEELRKKILEVGMPDNIREKALKELAKYSSTSSQSPESNVIRNYLDFIIELPWSVSSEDTQDLNIVKEKLDEDHYGLEKVKDRIIEYLAVKIKTKQNPQTILCLAGPPGTGKTSIAISIAKALGRKFVKQSLGGVRDEAEIRGHRRTYIGALPGRILSGMKEVKPSILFSY
jgi:ATP-dependent Lon protease